MFAHSFRFSSSFFRNAACAVLILVVVPPVFLADHGNVLAVALLIAAIAICWWIRDSWQEQFFDRNRAARGTHSAENRVRVIEMPAETFMRSERCPNGGAPGQPGNGTREGRRS